MKNYMDSDYAANKNAKSIVYRFANMTVEITLEVYLRENPGKTEDDFAELKALSDSIYLEQDKDDYRQTRKNVSLNGMGETAACAVPSPETEMIAQVEQSEHTAKEKRRRELGLKAFETLTEVQRRRFLLYHVDGLTEEQIAKRENATHQAVSKSLYWVERKIRKFLLAAEK